MSKLERLFVQIFDRRNWIVDQLKSQSDSYDQSLASCLLINGIDPPSWLWNAGFGTGNSDLFELKKELVTGSSFASKDGQLKANGKISTSSFDLDESLLRIRRSRSRQRALELRTSAKQKRKKPTDEEDIAKNHTGRVTRSKSAHEQPHSAQDLLRQGNPTTSSASVQSISTAAYCASTDGNNELPKALPKASSPLTSAMPLLVQNNSKITDNTVHNFVEPQPRSARNEVIELVPEAHHEMQPRIWCKPLDVHKISPAGPSLCTGSSVVPKQLNFDDAENLEEISYHACMDEKEERVSDMGTVKQSNMEINDVMTEQTPNSGTEEIVHDLGSPGAAQVLYGTSQSRPSPDTNTKMDAKQVNDKERDDCNLREGFQEDLQKGKQDTSTEKRHDCLKSTVLKGTSILEGCCNKDDQDKLMVEEEVPETTKDVSDKLGLVDTIEGHLETRYKLVEGCTLMNGLVVCLNVGNNSPEVTNLLNQTFSAANVSIPREFGERDLLESKSQDFDNFTDPNSIADPAPVGNCNTELETRPAETGLESPVLAEVMEPLTHNVSREESHENLGASKSRSSSTNGIASCTQPGKLNRLIAGEVISTVACDSNKNAHRSTLTLGSSYVFEQREEIHDFTRSPTHYRTSTVSFKSDDSDYVSGKSYNMEKDVYNVCQDAVIQPVTSCPAQDCSGMQKVLYLESATVHNKRGSLTPLGSHMSSEHQKVAAKITTSCRRTCKQTGMPCISQTCGNLDESEAAPCPLERSVSLDNNVVSSESPSSKNCEQPFRNTSDTCEVSWPLNKRRKVERVSNYALCTSPRAGQVGPLVLVSEKNSVKGLLNLHDSPMTDGEANKVLASVELDGRPFNSRSGHTRLQIFSNKSQPKQKKFEALLQLDSTCALQAKEDALDLQGIEHGPLQEEIQPVEVAADIHIGDKKSCVVPLCDSLIESSEKIDSVSNVLNVLMRQSPDTDPDVEFFSDEGRTNQKTSQTTGCSAFSYCSVPSMYEDDLGSSDNMNSPEINRFSFCAMKEDFTIFEQLNESAHLRSSVSYPQDVLQVVDSSCSLPEGIPKQMDQDHLIPSGATDAKQLLGPDEHLPSHTGCKFNVETSSNLKAKSYSFTPPVGKFYSKSSGSSWDTSLILKTELTCFRIDEDTPIDDTEGNMHENVGPSENAIGSKQKCVSQKREALADMTLQYNNSLLLASKSEMFERPCSSDSSNTEFQRSWDKLKNGNDMDHCDKSGDKENQSYSPGGHATRNATGSLLNRFDRPKVSAKASESKGGQSFIEKACRPKNIISNVSSFVPLVQQKQQPPALLTGKRNIKVRALEAADAAKRLEEEKQNARKLRKEAAKLEREKMEQENLKQLEMKQRKKEEKHKKKVADIAMRKRQREDEERKERERKRKCMEEARKQQLEREVKQRAEKEEKEMRRKAAEEERKRKALSEARRPSKMEKAKEETGNTKNRGIDPWTAKTTSSANSTYQNDVIFEEPNFGEKLENTVLNDCLSEAPESGRTQSYEISPYQPSEDEDEEEENVDVARKFVPEWSRENRVHESLDFLQQIDPDEIFLRERCCSINEIVLHLKT